MTMTAPLFVSNPTNEYRSIELDKHVLASIDHLIEVLMCKGHHSRALVGEKGRSKRTAIARINAMVEYFILTAFL